ncbi:MAG: EAL domain-containing protein, partial [Colwellia sp.]
MESLPIKTWKIFLFYCGVLLLVSFVLFEVSLSNNKYLLYKKHIVMTEVNDSSLTEPPIHLKIVSSLLLLPDIYLYEEKFVVATNNKENQVVIIPVKILIYNTLTGLITPMIALFVVALTSMICAAMLNIKKFNMKLKPVCQKIDTLLKSVDNTYQQHKNKYSLSYLHNTIDSLAKQTAIHTANIEKNVLCDKLTKLLERHTFLEHISQQIDISSKMENKCGLLFINLDGFKHVNDSFDHSFGDEVLIQVSERLRSIVRSQGLNFKGSKSELEFNLARLGGDEFTIFIQELKSSEDATYIASNILQELERDFILGNKNIKISASIGIAVYPDSAVTPNALLQMADVAMYRAKTEGRGFYRMYSPEMESKMRRYHYLLEEMSLAIDSNSFTLNFQPIIHIDGCTISYFEALVRWQHPIEGHIAPSEFIPIAEDSSLILKLGDWILDEACRQMASWHNAGMNKVRISVNVSGIQLKHRSLHQWVMRAINKSGLPACSLMIEITESCFIEASEDVIKQLEKLRGEGVLIAIDDFGTGFSSLSLLATLPVDILKIDQIFISKSIRNSKYNKVLCSIIDMATQLELKVVAEGVEQISQYELLKSLGVFYIQGYLFSHPQESNYIGKKIFHSNTN